MKTAMLAFSIVLNIGLATYLTSAVIRQPAARTETLEPSGGHLVPSLATDGVLDAATLRRLLLQHGLDDRETKSVVLAYLNAEAFAHDVSTPYEYWRPDDRHRPASRLEAAERSSESVRKSLLAIYGQEAQDDPAFATVFRPLQERLPFLSSEQQLALRRWQLEQRSAGSEMISSGPRVARGPVSASGSTTQDESIRNILQDEVAYREYAMRESPLAHRLRATGVEFAEREYRAVFELMDEFRANPSATAFVAQREAIRNVLGRDRALRLWAASDPLFREIKTISDRHGLQEPTVLDVYETVMDAQDDLLAMSASPRDARQAQYIRERIEQRDSTLRTLVGEAAADGLTEAMGSRFGGLRSLPAAPAFPH